LFVFEGFKAVEPPAKATVTSTTPAAALTTDAQKATDKATAEVAPEAGKPAEETTAQPAAGNAVQKAAETAPAAETKPEAASNLPALNSAISLASAISELLAPTGGSGDHMEDEDDADGDAGDEDEADGDLEADMDAFDDMDEDEDSDADDDDDMEGESWLGKRSDITKCNALPSITAVRIIPLTVFISPKDQVWSAGGAGSRRLLR
jgi:hypothetical protein